MLASTFELRRNIPLFFSTHSQYTKGVNVLTPRCSFDGRQQLKYEGEPTLSGWTAFLNEELHGEVIVLDASNFHLTSEGEWVVE